MDNFVFGVSELNGYIKELMDCDPALSSLFVRGEISNYKAYPSGHHYFSLKDEASTLKCVMFKREAQGLRFRPQNGMKVIALGRVGVFPRDGQYQLYCTRLTSDGVGDLHIAFEQLKEKLHQEGLFDPTHKKEIPVYPQCIALITSSAGAAVRDMLRVLDARWPLAHIRVLPVRVQGVEAPGEISRAIQFANAHQVADLIITGRGGGSIEDLWAFNEECVARAIYQSEIPVISAVGHEPDVTIADFVADLRAATPSNAAELAVPDQSEVAVQLQQLGRKLVQSIDQRVERAGNTLSRLAKSHILDDPMNYIDDRRMLLDHLTQRLESGFTHILGKKREQYVGTGAKLDAMSPLKVLGRGYAIGARENGTVVKSVKEVTAGERLWVGVSDGTIACRVESWKEGVYHGREETDV